MLRRLIAGIDPYHVILVAILAVMAAAALA